MTISEKKFEIALSNSNLTVTQLAERIGLSRGRLHTILNQKNVRPKTIYKISMGLGVEPTEIIE